MVQCNRNCFLIFLKELKPILRNIVFNFLLIILLITYKSKHPSFERENTSCISKNLGNEIYQMREKHVGGLSDKSKSSKDITFQCQLTQLSFIHMSLGGNWFCSKLHLYTNETVIQQEIYSWDNYHSVVL